MHYTQTEEVVPYPSKRLKIAFIYILFLFLDISDVCYDEVPSISRCSRVVDDVPHHRVSLPAFAPLQLPQPRH